MLTNEHLQQLHAAYRAQGHTLADSEPRLAWLRSQGCSKLDSIRTLMLCEGMSLRQAKQCVHTSITWSDVRADHDAFHDQLFQEAETVSNQIRRYATLPCLTNDEIEAIIVEQNPAQLHLAALSASFYSDDPIWAEDVCIRLANHPDEVVRGNAILAFGHIARIHEQLTREIVQPLIEQGLRDPSDYVRGQADSAADDVEHFLGWNLDRA